MPILGVTQPETLHIDVGLRLRKYDGQHDFALQWYQDEELVWLVDGDRKLYDASLLTKMYTYLNDNGELYWIEAQESGVWRPIGDVSFWQEDMPIVIADEKYRGRGVGKKIITALIQRGRELGYDHLGVDEIYDWNIASQRCFEKAGFRPCEKTEKGSRYQLKMREDDHRC